MEEKNNSFLGQEKLGKLLWMYAFPCTISLLVGALYNIVDQIFIANASYLGSYGNAANTVVFPLTVVALAIAVMIGDGCCASVSIFQGQKDQNRAEKAVGSAMTMLILTSVILTVIYLLFQHQIVTFFGGGVNEETYHQAREYFSYIAIGIPFYMIGQGLNPVIRSDGAPAMAMATTLAGCVLNIILDPIFIFCFHWGMMGAALATVAGQLVTFAISIWYVLNMKVTKLRRKNLRPDLAIVQRIISLGLCSLLSQISLVFSMAAINNMARKYGALDEIFGQEQYAQIPMAVIGIVMKFFQIVISCAVGLAAGCIPIAGYNIGAGMKARAKTLFKMLLCAETILGFIALLIVEFLPEQLIAIFGAAKESVYYTQFAIRCFRIYLCMMIFATVNKGTFIYLQALGEAIASALLSVVREVVFGVGFALLLPLFFALDGVLYSMPVSDILTFFISVVLIARTLKNLS